MNRRKFLKLSALVPFAGVIAKPALADLKEVKIEPLTASAAPLPKGIKTYNTLDTFIYDRNETIINVSFRNAIIPYRREFPYLALAIDNQEQAFDTKREWLIKDKKGKLHVEFNYTQIVRTPFGMTGTQMASTMYGEKQFKAMRKEALHQHLSDVNQAILSGHRTCSWQQGALFDGPKMQSCGGSHLFAKGTPALVVLRDLVLLTHRQSMDSDSYYEEFLSEFTLQVPATVK